MGQKLKGISAGACKFLVCVAFIILCSGTAFGQVSGLALNSSSDIRLEMVHSNNTLVGYNLFVRKKADIESVMLTEPTGYYALRSLAWNATNGNERRELSGVQLTDINSRYSILSSSPVADGQFGRAFQLFIPQKIVYGNPLSANGTVSLDTISGIRFNIRTFDHKYGDPNKGRFQNHLVSLNPRAGNILEAGYSESVPSGPSPNNADVIREELRDRIVNEKFLNQPDGYNDDLRDFLIYMFWEMERR